MTALHYGDLGFYLFDAASFLFTPLFLSFLSRAFSRTLFRAAPPLLLFSLFTAIAGQSEWITRGDFDEEENFARRR